MESRCVSPEIFNKGIWLVVDPGTHTAWETWENGKPSENGHGMLDWIGSSETPMEHRVILLNDKFRNRIAGCRFDGICIEGIRVLSFASATSGSLIFPSMLIGAYISVCHWFRQKYFIIDPKWRGQLNDTELRNILELKFGYIAKNEHLADVRGMGLWLSGKF